MPRQDSSGDRAWSNQWPCYILTSITLICRTALTDVLTYDPSTPYTFKTVLSLKSSCPIVSGGVMADLLHDGGGT